MLTDNQESPAAPAEKYDTLAVIPPDTDDTDVLDLLLRKLAQLRGTCNIASSGSDGYVSETFCAVADSLECCEQLATLVFKSKSADRCSFIGIPPGYIAIPEATYNDVSVTLEILNAQLLAASNTEFHKTNIEHTIIALVLDAQREAKCAIDYLSGCSRVRGMRQ